MKMPIPEKGTPWQHRVGYVLRVIFGGLVLAAGIALTLWESWAGHAHTGHQIIAGGLIVAGLWVIFEDKFLRALETVVNLIHVLLPWGVKSGGDEGD